MEIRVSDTSVTEGEVVEVSWDCQSAQSAEITIDNGFKSQSVSVEAQGSKKFKLNRSKGKTKLSVTAVENGKKVTKSVAVRVRKQRPAKAKVNNKQYDSYKRMSTPLKEKWNQTVEKVKYSWRSLTPTKRLSYKVLGILLIIIIISIFLPKFLMYGIMGLTLYMLFIK
ncbi:MAG: hypothetical protein PHP76_00300 [Bacteroidales bacterium]|nr:hypothetical protein [Bacteroidales bacterium]